MYKILKQKDILAIFLAGTVFTIEIGSVTLGSIRFDIISYSFFIFVFSVAICFNKIKISYTELMIFGYIFIVGLINIVRFDLPTANFFKQFIPILLIYYSCKYIFAINNVEYIFKKYIDFAILASIFGLIQITLKLMGITILSLTDRIYVDSFALEPSHYPLMVLPALVYFYEKKQFNWKFYTLLVSILLTFKLTAFLAIFIYLILTNLKKFKGIVFFIPLLVIVLLYLISQVSDFSDRVTSLGDFVESGNLALIPNLTTFSFLSNLYIAYENFFLSYGTGVGLGGHETMYVQNYNSGAFDENWIGINKESAHSLLIRIFSELGVLGILICLYLVFSLSKIANPNLKIIGLAASSHFIVKSIKLGGYFDYGTIFFLVLIITVINTDKKMNITKHRIRRIYD